MKKTHVRTQSSKQLLRHSEEHLRPIDIICMGRVAVDLYSEQIGSSLEETHSFKKYLGGCAGNIAVGTARLGLRSAMLSCIGEDAMGLFIKSTLQQEKVITQHVYHTKDHLTGLVLLGVCPPDRFPLIFYRQNCADMQLKKEHIDAHFLEQAKALLITGTGLSTAEMRITTHYAIETAHTMQTHIIFDLDYRPVLWGLTDLGDGETRYKISQQVSHYYQTILSRCDVIIGTEEEIKIAGNSSSLRESLVTIRSLTHAIIVVKKGERGCEIYTDDLESPTIVPGFPVTVLNVLGAGDAFLSGFVYGYLNHKSLDVCGTYGNACGAIVVTRHGCAPAMPYLAEIQQFIAEHQLKAC